MWHEPDLVRPLRDAEPDFLELLLTRFRLERDGVGARLSVRFDEDTPVIWKRDAKRIVQDRIADFDGKAKAYQEQLDGILLRGGAGPFVLDDPGFPFRYVSGGTLPVVSFLGDEDREYFALIYREVFPVGWNLANGGSDSSAELRNPFETIERELREELVMFDGALTKLYVFDSVSGKPEVRPEWVAARKLWERRPELFDLDDFGKMEEELIPIKWLGGPDTLQISESSELPRLLQGCFLNINAEDFGIEVDRIARITLSGDAILFDGEILRGQLVNSPVGLFEVGRMQAPFRGDTDLVPDFFFYDGRRYADGQRLLEVLREDFVPRMARLDPRWDRREWDEAPHKLGMCPVTERLLRRALPLWSTAEEPGGSYDIFVSSAGEDTELSGQVCAFLQAHAQGRVFWSRELDNADFSRSIDNALTSARCLISVATHPRYLEKEWVQYEHRAFHSALRDRLKPPNAQLLSYVSGFPPQHLPLPLRHYQAVQHDSGAPEQSLRKIIPYVERAGRV